MILEGTVSAIWAPSACSKGSPFKPTQAKFFFKENLENITITKLQIKQKMLPQRNPESLWENFPKSYQRVFFRIWEERKQWKLCDLNLPIPQLKSVNFGYRIKSSDITHHSVHLGSSDHYCYF